MIQRGDRPSFTLETFGELLRGNLDGDISSEAGIAGAIHLAHAARPDQADDFIRTKLLSSNEAHLSISPSCLVRPSLRINIVSSPKAESRLSPSNARQERRPSHSSLPALRARRMRKG